VLREERRKHHVEQSGFVDGDIEALAAEEDGDYFIVVRKRETEEDNKDNSEGQSEDGEE